MDFPLLFRSKKSGTTVINTREEESDVRRRMSSTPGHAPRRGRSRSPRANIIRKRGTGCDKGHHKEFSSKLFARWDPLSRARLRAVFGRNTIQDNEDKYGADFKILDTDCKYRYLEVQVVSAWRDGEKYPYEKVSVFARKGRYESDQVLFISLNRSLTAAYLFELRDEDRSNPVPVFPGSKEFMFVIPKERCHLLYLHVVDGSILRRLYPK